MVSERRREVKQNYSPDAYRQRCLEDALDLLARFGFSIVPLAIRTKLVDGELKCIKPPALKSLKPYQVRPATEAELVRSFRNPQYRVNGLGVMLGAVSGNFCTRDLDNNAGIAAYFKWARDRPDLAASIPTVRTGRGIHLHFRVDPKFLKTIAKSPEGTGEYRASGYVAFPRSWHLLGDYHWIVPLGDSLPLIDPLACGLLEGLPFQDLLPFQAARAISDLGCPVPGTKKDTIHPSPEVLHGRMKELPTSFSLPLLVCVPGPAREEFLGEFPAGVQDAVRLSLPTGPGQRNNRIMALAGRLKAAGIKTLDQAERILRVWHALALPVIRTKDYDETLKAFSYAWPNAEPCSSQVLRRAAQEAKTQPLPACAEAWPDPCGKQILAFCAALQRHTPGVPFRLSSRTVAAYVDFARNKCNKVLNDLAAAGLLRQVRPGQWSESKRLAPEWLFLGVDA